MKSLLSTLSLGLLLIGSHVSAAPASDPASDLEDPTTTIESTAPESNPTSAELDAEESGNGPPSLSKMTRKYQQNIKKILKERGPGASCTMDKLSIRKEWGSMSKKQRICYTDAVKCLYSINKPISNPSEVPGARNRFDDFVASHIQQGLNIHFNGYFFAWHRNFVWIYEQALRKECGYKGPTPYWDWTLSADDPRLSPVFDGSKTSMSGNGETIPHGATFVPAFGLNLTLPPGTGGGCVKDGPFADLSVNLGVNPIVLPANPDNLTANLSSTASPSNGSSGNDSAPRVSDPIADGLSYNPRCLTRDINLFWSNQTRIKDLEFLLSCNNVDCFEKRADGWEFDPTVPQPLVHPAGHFAFGGLQNDPFASPGDPAFYLHHAQVDRVYSIWQGQDPGKRFSEIGGTQTPFNTPPSGPVALNDTMDFGAISNKVKLKDVLSTIDGPYCYMYD